MQSISSRIWTRVAVSIAYDDNHYTTGTSSDYIYSEHGIIPGLASGISIVPNNSLSVLLYLSCNKTLSLFYVRVDCSFPLKYYLFWSYPT